jgi:hypothetical protein
MTSAKTAGAFAWQVEVRVEEDTESVGSRCSDCFGRGVKREREKCGAKIRCEKDCKSPLLIPRPWNFPRNGPLAAAYIKCNQTGVSKS